jgi:hypothetical protein
VVGLLFFALVILAFGQADAARNSNQSAADSAALAAAQESRDQLKSLFLANALNGDWLRDIFDGNQIGTYDGCLAAQRFASLNDAGNVQCTQLSDGRWGFTVSVTSNKSMGRSILPGTDGQHAQSHATAVVEPRCSFVPAPGAGTPGPQPSTLPAPVGGGPGDPGGSGGNGGKKKPSPGTITCSDRDWQIDPDHLDLLPDMADLFTVRLAEN